MKPFLLLVSRSEDTIAESEYAAFCELSGLDPVDLKRVRLERGTLPPTNLDDYSGIILGGSPFNASDPPEIKTNIQKRVERDISRILDEAVERDFPFLGACYGIGTLTIHQGGTVDRRFGEPLEAISVELTDAGAEDPLFAGMPRRFDGFVGHKEACSALPPGATLLATGSACPVQAYRVKHNLYATQFHPEMKVKDLVERARVYQHHGYFEPSELDATIEAIENAPPIIWPSVILRNFAERFARA